MVEMGALSEDRTRKIGRATRTVERKGEQQREIEENNSSSHEAIDQPQPYNREIRGRRRS